MGICIFWSIRNKTKQNIYTMIRRLIWWPHIFLSVPKLLSSYVVFLTISIPSMTYVRWHENPITQHYFLFSMQLYPAWLVHQGEFDAFCWDHQSCATGWLWSSMVFFLASRFKKRTHLPSCSAHYWPPILFRRPSPKIAFVIALTTFGSGLLFTSLSDYHKRKLAGHVGGVKRFLR